MLTSAAMTRLLEFGMRHPDFRYIQKNITTGGAYAQHAKKP